MVHYNTESQASQSQSPLTESIRIPRCRPPCSASRYRPLDKATPRIGPSQSEPSHPAWPRPPIGGLIGPKGGPQYPKRGGHPQVPKMGTQCLKMRETPKLRPQHPKMGGHTKMGPVPKMDWTPPTQPSKWSRPPFSTLPLWNKPLWGGRRQHFYSHQHQNRGVGGLNKIMGTYKIIYTIGGGNDFGGPMRAITMRPLPPSPRRKMGRKRQDLGLERCPLYKHRDL